MGSVTVPDRSDGQIINETWFDLLQAAISGNIVPRNSSGVATSEQGSLGESALKFLKAHITSGYWDCGDMKFHHSYNGAAPAGEGWMLCDGRQVTEANYNTEHGSGHWATYVGSSPLLNKYLPNMDSKYPIGKDTTTQDGSAPITTVGNSGHLANIAHTHTLTNHVHQWYRQNATNAPDNSYDNSGSTSNITGGSSKTVQQRHLTAFDSTSDQPLNDFYTKTAEMSGGTASSGAMSANGTPNIQPESIEGQWYMRII